MNEQSDSAAELLGELGLPPRFFDDLNREDDWSLIIKLHALFEAVLAGLIARRLKEPALESVLAKLEFNDARAGKVAFAKALDLLNPKDETFLRGLSELRNKLIHDVRNVGFNLREYVAGLDKNQKAKFKREFGEWTSSLQDGASTYQRLLDHLPGMLISLAGYSCLLALKFNLRGGERDMLVKALLAHDEAAT